MPTKKGIDRQRCSNTQGDLTTVLSGVESMAKPIKAVRGTIEIGSVTLNVYQLPDGSYKLAGRNVTDAVDEPNNSLIRCYGVKSLKYLPGADLSLIQIKAESGESFLPVSIPDAFAYWVEMLKKGNAKAQSLVIACGIETIERRADRAFGVKVAEEEYDRKLAERMKGLTVRRELTDVIEDYKKRHPELSDNDKHWMYPNVSDLVNLAVFGRKAKQLVEDFGASRDKLRDWMTADELRWVYEIEELTKRLIDQFDMHPIDAAKESRNRLVIPVVNRIAS